MARFQLAVRQRRVRAARLGRVANARPAEGYIDIGSLVSRGQRVIFGIRENGHVAVQRMDNVGIVVDDLPAAIAFFHELGLELEGRAMIEGDWSGPSLDCATSASRSR